MLFNDWIGHMDDTALADTIAQLDATIVHLRVLHVAALSVQERAAVQDELNAAYQQRNAVRKMLAARRQEAQRHGQH